MNIGERIRHIREQREWSQLELAKRTGLARPTISNIERGQHPPSWRAINRIQEGDF